MRDLVLAVFCSNCAHAVIVKATVFGAVRSNMNILEVFFLPCQFFNFYRYHSPEDASVMLKRNVAFILINFCQSLFSKNLLLNNEKVFER